MIKNLNHALLCIAVQFAGGIMFGQWDIFAAFSVLFFAGREHAQAEYRWIEKYGGGRRANMKWQNAFEFKVWDFHSFWWNLTFPIIVVAAVAVVAELIKGA